MIDIHLLTKKGIPGPFKYDVLGKDKFLAKPYARKW